MGLVMRLRCSTTAYFAVLEHCSSQSPALLPFSLNLYKE
jgi:hypothetical protein